MIIILGLLLVTILRLLLIIILSLQIVASSIWIIYIAGILNKDASSRGLSILIKVCWYQVDIGWYWVDIGWHWVDT